jgi:5'(3')-deoxyribonucleotidase
METREFMEKLVSQVSLDAIDFTCDLEQVLAEEVKYLRKLINTCAEQDAMERDAAIRELRARLADKDAQIRHLLEENRFLRERFTTTLG